MNPLVLIVRGFGDGIRVFEERHEIDPSDLEDTIAKLAVDHMDVLKFYDRYMLEFEFPQYPEEERFLRFGTDPRRMVLPTGVKGL